MPGSSEAERPGHGAARVLPVCRKSWKCRPSAGLPNVALLLIASFSGRASR
jgi:hypothetical protein